MSNVIAMATDSAAGPSPEVPGAGADGVFEFPEGLLGFERARRFVLASADREGLYWLQSLDQGSLAFLLCDPFRFIEGFSVDLGARELAGGFADCREDLAVLSIVTLPSERGRPATVNLQGPVLFDFKHMRARQVPLADSAWGVAYPVDLRRAAAVPAPARTGT
jgi:flagellar assembly factor FliW